MKLHLKKKNPNLLDDTVRLNTCFCKDQNCIILTLNVKKLKKFGNGSSSLFSFT